MCGCVCVCCYLVHHCIVLLFFFQANEQSYNLFNLFLFPCLVLSDEEVRQSNALSSLRAFLFEIAVGCSTGSRCASGSLGISSGWNFSIVGYMHGLPEKEIPSRFAQQRKGSDEKAQLLPFLPT